jgi:hypothetical protein
VCSPGRSCLRTVVRSGQRSASDLAKCPQAGRCLRNSASFESLPSECSYGLGRRVSPSVGGHRNLPAGGRQVGTAAVTEGERLLAPYCSGSRLWIAALRLPIQSQTSGRFGTAVLCAHIAPLAVNPWAAGADLWAWFTCAIGLATTREYGFVTSVGVWVTRRADLHSVGLRRLLHRRMHETATIRVLPARLA